MELMPGLVGEVLVEVDVTRDNKCASVDVKEFPAFHASGKPRMDRPSGLGGELAVMSGGNKVLAQASKNLEHAKIRHSA